MAPLAELLRGEVDWSTEAWGVAQGSYLLSQSLDVPERWYDENGQRLEYRDWTPETTRVVSGPYGYSNFPGRWFPDRKLARRYWKLRARRIYEEFFIPGRWIFRIPKETHGAAGAFPNQHRLGVHPNGARVVSGGQSGVRSDSRVQAGG